jgi:hypothetical protein
MHLCMLTVEGGCCTAASRWPHCQPHGSGKYKPDEATSPVSHGCRLQDATLRPHASPPPSSLLFSRSPSPALCFLQLPSCKRPWLDGQTHYFTTYSNSPSSPSDQTVHYAMIAQSEGEETASRAATTSPCLGSGSFDPLTA